MTAPAGYTVRRPARADVPQLEAFARDVWSQGRTPDLARRWWWNDPKQPECWIAIHDRTGAVAAMCGERRSTLVMDGERVPAASICDWNVSPRHAGLGLGRLLVSTSRETHPVLYTTSISESAAVAFSRMGWSGDTLLSVLVAAPPVTFALSSARSSTRARVELFEVSNDRHAGIAHVGALWERSREACPVMTARDADFVQSHLALVPDRRYGLAVAFSAAGAPTGYALFRILPRGSFRRFGYSRVGLVVDFWVPSAAPSVLIALMRSVSSRFTVAGVPVMLALSTQRWVRDALARAGFASSETRGLGRIIASLGSRAMYAADRPLPDFTDGWHVTFADNDMDLIFGSAPL